VPIGSCSEDGSKEVDGYGNELDTGLKRRKLATYLVGGRERKGVRFKDTIVGLTMTGCSSLLRVLRYALWIAARTFSGPQVPRFQLSFGTKTRTVTGGWKVNSRAMADLLSLNPTMIVGRWPLSVRL